MKFSAIVTKKLEGTGDGSTIVYTDFARHVGPIVCALHDNGINAVGYYGSMSDKEKEESHKSWHNGSCKVMVATRAFGLGINKKNIRLVVRHGLPPDLSSWVQEFGRAGRDGLPASACIVYSDDDIQHLSYWLSGGDRQRNSSVATAFSEALNFSYAYLARKCRHEVVLEGFGEHMVNSVEQCCDVCALPPVSLDNRSREFALLVSAIDELGTKGEKKLAQFLRGSNYAWIKELPIDLNSSKAYGKSPPQLSLEWWRSFARQCSVAGYLNRKVDCGTFQGRHGGVFSYFEVSPKGRSTIAGDEDVLLPPLDLSVTSIPSKRSHGSQSDNQLEVQKKKRTGRGSNPLSTVRDLMNNKENWQDITSKEQYQYPGVSTHATLNKIYFSSDISQLPQYVEEKPHFLWEDIQLSKGKLNPDRCITLNVDGSNESVFYRIAPCNGIKLCSATNCQHVQTRNSKKNLCPTHTGSPTINTENCPVVFIYLFPQNFASDNRRYSTYCNLY